ncbi:MAG: hypothetical protein HN726_05700 [Candidatus Magasanikbacteria bacterium]|jgi:hypothetical protein|nr:hypothetical protein [Candidatus Magasanikbacteria bacterium]
MIKFETTVGDNPVMITADIEEGDIDNYTVELLHLDGKRVDLPTLNLDGLYAVGLGGQLFKIDHIIRDEIFKRMPNDV